MTLAGSRRFEVDERVHLLEVVEGSDVGQRHTIGPAGAVIGRKLPADIVLPDTEVSRAHCRLDLRGEDVWVTDLGSTNGAFVDGSRVGEPVILPVGAILQVGRQSLKHDCRTRSEWLRSDELDRDLETASSYVHALLPPPVVDGPIRAEWVLKPCAKLGGDAFGYGALPDGRFAAYLMDVAGHGAGAALHSVAVMNVLRQRALPGVDMGRPDQVLAVLNDMFPMDTHAGLFFTLWYGVFDPAARTLEFASAGHHPAFLIPADRSESVPLRTPNVMIGAVPGRTYKSETVAVPPEASVYLFSDGVFEIVTREGAQWSLQDFLPLLVKAPVQGMGECARLFDEVTRAARPGDLDDDFSMVVLTFS